MSEIFRGRIKEIVRGSDLATLSSKKIREQLEQEFKTDLSKRKKEIDDIVMGLLVSESQSEQSQNATNDEEESDEAEVSTSHHHKKKKKSKHKEKSSNSHKRKQNDEIPSKAKKSKSENSSNDESETTARDEELARMLQEEDEMDDGGRSGLRTRKKPPKATKTKEQKKKPAKKESMFKKEMVLSPELADIMGTNRMARSEVVQRMWQIIKERDLRDPSNKQYHICDDQLLKVFGIRRVRTFSMMKYLKAHVKDPALLTDS